MLSISRAAILAALAAPTAVTALKVEQHVQYGPAIYKKVRSIIYTGQQDSINDGRDLQETESATLRCFYQCLEQGMTSEQCVEYIQDTLGEDLSLHEIPELKIKVSPPRTPEAIDASYWMFGIPTNIYGQVDCDVNDGIIEYPWGWQTGPDVTVTIPPVDCIGMDAHDCCDKFLTTVTNENIPLVDINGNCLSCWVHQEPLEPIISAATNTVAYVEHSFDVTTSSCAATELSPADVQATDSSVETTLVTVRAGIDNILGQQPINCGDFMSLYRDLLFYGRAFPQAMSQISGLLCGICATPNDEYELTNEMKFRLEFIKLKLTGEINSDENCIVIYTDHQDLVLEPPKIGGSRHELDYDRMDPDCESPDTTGDNPGGNNNAGGPDGTTCPDGQTYDPVMGCISTGDVPDETEGPEEPEGPEEQEGPEGPEGPDGTDGSDEYVCPSVDMVTPEMATGEGDCPMQCTIDQIIANEIFECGTDLPLCFANECQDDWSRECLRLMKNKRIDAIALQECIAQGYISPNGTEAGPTAGGNNKGKSAKTKSKAKAKAKSVKTTVKNARTKVENAKTKAGSNKSKSKSRRRSRNLRNSGSRNKNSNSIKEGSKKNQSKKSKRSTRSKRSTKSKTSNGGEPNPTDGPGGDGSTPTNGSSPPMITMCVRTCEEKGAGFYTVGKVPASAVTPAPPTLPEGNAPEGTTTGGSMSKKKESRSRNTKAGSKKNKNRSTETKKDSIKTNNNAGSAKTKSAKNKSAQSKSRRRGRSRQL